MSLFNLKGLLVSSIGACLIGLGVGAVGTAHYKNKVFTAKINEQKAEAAKLLLKENEKALTIERAHNKLANQLEVINHEKNKKINTLLSDNRKLSAKLGGLRDPGRRQGCPAKLPTTTSTSTDSTDATDPARLSNEASEFLLEFAHQADTVAQYANTCHAWIKQLELR